MRKQGRITGVFGTIWHQERETQDRDVIVEDLAFSQLLSRYCWYDMTNVTENSLRASSRGMIELKERGKIRQYHLSGVDEGMISWNFGLLGNEKEISNFCLYPL
jgi:hypothetical protein